MLHWLHHFLVVNGFMAPNMALLLNGGKLPVAKKGRNASPVSELVSDVLDPVLRRRAGISMNLLQSWEEIAGERLGRQSRPEKIDWPRRAHEDDPFEPATLTIACEGTAALLLQHETTEVMSRINAFLGFAAIGRIKIVQKQIADLSEQGKRPGPELSDEEIGRLAKMVGEIEDEGLKTALEQLGRNVLSSSKRSLTKL